MSARAGMANLLLELRAMTNAGTADTTLNATTYWTDDQLQDICDKYQTVFKDVAIVPTAEYVSGAYEYKEYALPVTLEWFEEDGVDSGWAVRDASGDDAPSHTVSYESRRITFAASTAGTTYYLSCRVYDLNSAAAEVWRKKASFVALQIDWKSDNHDNKSSQKMKHCLAMAEHYEREAGGQLVELYRGDMV